MENVWNIGDIAMKAYEGDLASEKILIEMISWGLILQAVFVALTLLLWQAAPYGRYANNAGSLWGIKVNGRLAWIIQESPCVILPFIFHYYDAPRMNDLGNRILFWAYLLHYLNRSIVFPLRIQGGKPTPISVMLMALGFTTVNSYIQARWVTKFADYSNLDSTDQLRFLIGGIIFLAGLIINWNSDHILRNLRKPGEKGYKIPKGGMFTYVSGANFFGEILEWGGFALMGWNIVGLSFFIYTASNIGPRGIQHHQWYLTKFEDYPKERKALIPFIL